MGGYLAIVLALLAWLAQFVAWRRAVVAKEQLELVAEQLERVKRLSNHPAYRDEQFARWVRAESR